MLCLISSKKT